MLQSCGIFEASLRSERREMHAAFPCKSPTSDKENKVFGRSRSPKNGGKDGRLTTLGGLSECKRYSSLPKLEKQQYHAAVKLQKVYKSFRTRRQLADCAVVVEQRWWKLLDFAELKRSSISFFDIEKPETALSRWSRARTRAAKVGKGLSKDAKARKLALQHWLEAIDPRHRYGHNLQFYYVKWLHCQSKQPFFYWLDIGDGREVNFDRCSRLKLLQQCIKYLGPTERKAYEVVVNHRKLVYNQSGKFLDTTEGPKDAKWIFVLSTSKSLYVGQKKKGTFQHSSFLAGGATLSAGRLVVDDGVLKAVWPHSGHYLPTEENFQEFKSFLKEHDVDLANVKESPAEDEEEVINKKSNGDAILDNRSNADLPPHNKVTDIESLNQESIDSIDSRPRDSNVAPNADDTQTSSNLSRELCSKITRLKIPSGDEVFDIFQTEEVPRHNSCHIEPPDSPSDEDYESAEDPFLTEEDFMFAKINLFDKDEEEEEEEEKIPKEKILKRIDSHKGMKSYQLAKQLSSKWTTGVGPRIGFMRDYPSELQFRVLEQANLSPRSRTPSSTPRLTSRYNAKVSKSTSFCK